MQKIFSWVTEELKTQNYEILSELTPVRLVPWSEVYKLQTNHGWVFVKKLHGPFSIEVRLLEYINNLNSFNVPRVISTNDTLKVLLLTDSGNPLRERLKENYDVKFVLDIIKSYVDIQQTCCNKTDDLLQLSLSDWRLEHLPHLYLNLLNETQFLKRDGLSEFEINKLIDLAPNLSSLCSELASYKIPETIDHGDFHDNNILVKNNHFVINDWADSIITHPFFSLCSFLFSAHRVHKLNEDIIRQIRVSYLQQWTDYIDEQNLLKAYKLAEKINPIKYSLGFYRIMLCPGIEPMKEYQGTIANALKAFINS